MKQAVTIAGVAERARVSIATVSRVLNRQHTGDPGIRERVFKAVEELGYEPSAAARALAEGRSRTRSMGFVMDSYVPLGTYYGDILRGAEEEARKEGYDLYFSTAHHNLAVIGKGSRPRDLTGQAVQGIIFAGDLPADFHRVAAEALLRIVQVNSCLPGEAADCIMCDNFAASYRAVRWLCGLGHRRIACMVCGQGREAPNPPSVEERLMGYRQALVDEGLVWDPQLLEWGGSVTQDGEAAMGRLAQVRPRPTAVFATVDEMAVGAIARARRLGWRVPEDLSVVGFNDLEMATLTDPPLTTIRVPTREMGRAAVQRALALLKDPEQAPRRIEVLTEFVVRGSCGPPSAPSAVESRASV